jgi:hypothetical protein
MASIGAFGLRQLESWMVHVCDERDRRPALLAGSDAGDGVSISVRFELDIGMVEGFRDGFPNTILAIRNRRSGPQ